jgi:nitrogen fixation protein FixH
VRLQLVQVLFGQLLQVEQYIVSAFQGADDLVELELQGLVVAVLRVLDQEDHQKGDDGRRRVDHQLPGVAIVENGSREYPRRDDEEGQQERNRMTHLFGNPLGEAGKKILGIHHEDLHFIRRTIRIAIRTNVMKTM